MEMIGTSVYIKEFGNQEKEEINEKFYLEASSTFPLGAYKWKINITLYNIDAAMTIYLYHHDDQIYSWCNDRFCKPVDKICIFLLHGRHYQFIEGRGTEVLTMVA